MHPVKIFIFTTLGIIFSLYFQSFRLIFSFYYYNFGYNIFVFFLRRRFWELWALLLGILGIMGIIIGNFRNYGQIWIMYGLYSMKECNGCKMEQITKQLIYYYICSLEIARKLDQQNFYLISSGKFTSLLTELFQRKFPKAFHFKNLSHFMNFFPFRKFFSFQKYFHSKVDITDEYFLL